jgi:glycosyltransferase involved in cell wall biosynthesis
VIVPVRNGPALLRSCIEAIQSSAYKDYEIIVVDDASTDNTPEVAEAIGVPPLRLKKNCGPALARNRGAELARGKYLFFIDADVRVHPETIGQIAECLEKHPTIDAVFGSYDLYPRAYNILSQYRNLFHHFVHQQGRSSATTFWSGCGAIKRSVFLEMGGFDASYGRPCIEDIELGARLHKKGCQILLRKDIQVTHLKKWTLWSMFKADVKDRGIPWTELILRERHLPNDLNLKSSQRISAALACGVLGAIFMAGWQFYVLLFLPIGVLLSIVVLDRWSETRRVPTTVRILAVLGVLGAIAAIYYYRKIWLMLALAFLVGIVLFNFRFYAFFARERHPLFAALVVPLHVFYYVYSGVSFVLGAWRYVWKNKISVFLNRISVKAQVE